MKSSKLEKLEAKSIVLEESIKAIDTKIDTLGTFYSYLQVRAWRKYKAKLKRLLRYNQEKINQLKTPRNNARDIIRDGN